MLHVYNHKKGPSGTIPAVTMKLLLCLVLAVAAVTSQTLTDEQKRNWKKWSEECQTQSGVSQESINKIRNNQFDEVDDKIKAHSLCFSKKSGLANESGDIDVAAVKERLRRIVTDETEIGRIVTKCVVKKGTQAETAFETFKCLRQSLPKFSPV